MSALFQLSFKFYIFSCLRFSHHYFLLVCLLETRVDSDLFLATFFSVQLCGCGIFCFSFNAVMFLPSTFYSDCLFIRNLGLGPPYYFLVKFI